MNGIRPTWAEVSLGAIASNMQNTCRLLKPGTRLMAVVKANAYGHGMFEVARTAMQSGADYLGVASIDEALELREQGISANLLVLGYTPGGSCGPAVKNRIELTVFDRQSAAEMSREAVREGGVLQIHLKLDTGMNRIGFAASPGSLEDAAAIHVMPGLEIKGLFSHFAVSDIVDKDFSQDQFKQFNDFYAALSSRGISIPLRHMANSAAIIDLPETHLDMVRAGIMLYGYYPSPVVQKERISLIPAMRLISQVVQVKTLEPGDTVSYGRTFTADKPVVVATVPIGYADGYSRLLSNRIWAGFNGVRAEQIGTICMDQCMFDVSGIPGVAQGDPVVLFGRPADGLTADDVADAMGTISYEVLCKVSGRVPRYYIR